MRTAATVVESARRLGFTLRPVGGRIAVKPAGKLPGDLRDELLARKVEVIAILTGRACEFFWGHRPVGSCARCGKNYRDHLSVIPMAGDVGSAVKDQQ